MYFFLSLTTFLFVNCFYIRRIGAVPAHKVHVRQNGAATQAAIANGHWVDTWSAMPQLTEYTNLPPPPWNSTDQVFFNATLRQTLHMSIGGEQIRLRISNAFGVNDLPITAVTIAQPVPQANASAGASGILTNTLQTLTFSGSSNVTIPDGSLIISDPINFPIQPLSTITVTMYLAQGQMSNNATNLITSHPGSRTTSWFSSGNYVDAQNMTDPSTQSAAHWYFVSAVEVYAPLNNSAFAIVGDSITDGRGSDNNANNRWLDLVLNKMQANAATATIAVVNQAAGGNQILHDGNGPNALGRIDRDVLSQSGIKYAMIFEGVNDIGTTPNTTSAQNDIYNRLIVAYSQIISRVHTFGIPIFAATITPFSAPNSTIQAYSDPIRENTRQKINNWIKTSGKFDAVVDFAAILEDPKNPSQLNPIYNSGDYLHPNVMGYSLIASQFPLGIFEQFAGGVNTFQ